MRMEAGLDTGPVLARTVVAIESDDTTPTLEAKLATAGGALLAARLDDLVHGRLQAQPQDDALCTLAPPLAKMDGRIDWTLPARVVHAHIRAMQPWPIAFTDVGRERWKVFAEGLGLQDDTPGSAPGQIVRLDGDAAWIACGSGQVRVGRMQRPDKRQMSAAEVLRGARLGPNSFLGSSSSLDPGAAPDRPGPAAAGDLLP